MERGLSYASDTSEPSIRKQPLSSDITRRLKKPKENPANKVNQERYNLYKNQYIKTSDSRGIPEMIACFELAPDMSFEEMRASRYKRSSSPTFWEETTLNEEGKIESLDPE